MSNHLPESSLASILAEQGVHHQEELESVWLAKDNPETNPIIIKPETVSHVTELFSWVPLPSCSPPRYPFPIKSFALSAHVSPRTIHFRVLDKSPVSGPGRGPLSYNNIKSINSLVLSFLYGSTLTSIRDYWKNYSFDHMDLCWQNNISVFQYAV